MTVDEVLLALQARKIGPEEAEKLLSFSLSHSEESGPGTISMEQVAAGFQFFTLCCTRTHRIWRGRGINQHSWGRNFFLRIMLCRGGGCCPERRIWRWRGQR